ncbi:MAG TPA: hypothetical protein VK674_07120 [Candidatus Limnocylindria bacterium]|nr:hypothetical protein [Candidatus Limnocylindria bacterium]
MSTQEQEKIIKELRGKAIKITIADGVKVTDKVTKIDKKTVWEKAKRAGETINDDTLPTPHTAGA